MPADRSDALPGISRRTVLRAGIAAALSGPAIARVTRVREYERLPGLDLINTALSPSEVGQWTPTLPGPQPVVAVHAILLHTGSVLVVEGKTAYVWDPVSGANRRVDPPRDLFCAGHCHLKDGKVLFIGGYLGPQGANLGPRWNHTFDPITLTWTRRTDSRRGRWYPSTTLLHNGKVLITGGTDENTLFNTDIDIYSSGTLTKIGSRSMEYYPLQHVMKSGKVLSIIPDNPGTTYFINTGTSSIKQMASSGVERAYAASVLLPAGTSGSNKMMIFGGAVHLLNENNVYSRPHASTQMFDASNPSAGWRFMAPMPEPRVFPNAVSLPDGTVLVVGGENVGVATRNAALYNPATNSWRTLAAQEQVRSYHATAVLLPDGRVLSAGDNHPGGGFETLEIFSPPYLFRGARPVITGAPTKARNTYSFTFGTSGHVARVVLMAPGATTHSFDMNQRHVELAFTRLEGGGIKAKVPSKYVAIPGWYMLFVINGDGVPSVARWIRVTV